MGGATSAQQVLEFTPEPSTSTPVLPVKEQLSRLPQITAQSKETDDAVWEDLRRLSQIQTDSNKKDIEDSFVQIWNILQQWLKAKENTVHERQDEIHRLLEDVRSLAKEVQIRADEERKKCEKLRDRLKSVRKMRDGAMEIGNQLEEFSRRLNDL